MLKSGALLVALLCTQALYASGTDSLFTRKNTHQTVAYIPTKLPESAVVVLPCRTSFSLKDLSLLWDDADNPNFDDLPDEYDLWDESLINPYGVRMVDMVDTIKINMRGYVPPTKKYVTSNFGFRRAQFHYGIDLKVHKGDTVFCAFDGQVRITRYDRRGYGHFVVVRHPNGLETLYGHFDKTLVTPGQSVKAGEALGLGGNTGRSYGYHLHFETRYLGNAINPNDLYDFDECCVKNDVFWLSAANFAYVKEVERVRVWTVRSGDTLGKIAANTGVSISRLCTLNNIKKTSVLRIGQKIRYT